jgi:hypothetical protein
LRLQCALAFTVVAALACTWLSAHARPANDDLPNRLYLPILAVHLGREDLPPLPTVLPSPTPTPTLPATATLTELPPTPTPTATPCPGLADRVTITTVSLGAPIRANDEYFPLPVAPRPDGGALVAWREQAALRIRVGTFDDQDRLVGTPLSFAGEEVHALVAHPDGGAMAVVENDPDIYSAKYCRGSATPDKPYCAKLDLWRFDSDGRTLWRTTATGKKNVDSDGALFIWWYQHTARLAWTGSEYGLYFRSASSSPRPGVPGEIDIHAGDTFRFLDGAGNLLDGAWGWGCSHSWAVRLVFNGHFGAACHGDAYPNAFHVNVLDRQRRLGEANLHEGLDPTKRALGGLVPTPDGFWLLHMAQGTQAMELHLAFVDNAGRLTRDQVLPEATALETAYPFRPYLAEYGADQMLAGWFGNGTLHLAVLDRGTGDLVMGPVGVTAKIDQWNEMVPFPNGDVGWAWSAGGTDRLDMVRVKACGKAMTDGSESGYHGHGGFAAEGYGPTGSRLWSVR